VKNLNRDLVAKVLTKLSEHDQKIPQLKFFADLDNTGNRSNTGNKAKQRRRLAV
jgi:hypothetical protein